MVVGTCQLCGQTKSLSNSHVVPEFFYEGTYGAGHQFISVTNHPLHRPRPMQKGLRERLLCAQCEEKFSKYETYSAALLRRVDNAPETRPGLVIIPDVDLSAFRLFGLSLLWRAHVAKGHMFRDVRLGPHAQRIRTMLHSEDAGEPHEYAFTFARIAGLETHGKMIIAPMPARYDGHRIYHFMARGYEWVFMVANVSAHIREVFPYVGSERALVVATVTHDKRQLFSALRRAFPDSLAG